MKTRILILLLATSVLFTGFSGQVARADEAGNPSITIYVVPPITDEKILPTTAIPGSHISSEISITASRGEYEPASFVIKALNDIASLEVEATQLEGESDSIPSSNIDIRVVKSWYQAGYGTSDNTHKHLTPELLLKDDSLVKVENEHNYLKKTDGAYMWISDPTLTSDRHRPRTIDEIPVKDSPTLQPVDIPANTNKQFWVTIKIPEGASPGSYTGNIELRTSDGVLGLIELSVEVLPIELLEPYLEYSIYYTARLSTRWPEGTISRSYKSEQQLRAEMKDCYSHGVTNPTAYQGAYQDPVDMALLGRFLAIRNEMGMGNQPLYYVGLGDNEIIDVGKVPGILSVAQSYGVTEVYFYGIDEALGNRRGGTSEEAVERLLSQRSTWEQVHALGGKIFVAGVKAGKYSDVRSPGEFGFVGDLLDLLVCHGPPSKEESARWHSVGHRIFVYSNPPIGEENPETYRRNYGLLLWQADYDGAMNWAWNYDWGNPWNDFDDSNGRGRMFGYPTMDGVVDTVQWEGWREGVDDVRYLTTLLEAIQIAKAEGRDTSVAEAWLANLKSLDLTQENLDVVRSEMIDHILSLIESANQPPVLSPIGDRVAEEEALLEFIISATDPDGDSLAYSASNLPQGATFDSQTRTFYWIPISGQTGVYSDIHFEVSDGVFTDSKDITITVPLPPPPPPPSGGGGFVPLLPPPQPPGVTDVSNIIGSDGIFTEIATVQSDDGKGVLTIQKGTKGLTRDGEALDRIIIIEMQELPTPPDDSNVIGLAYNFGPDGATFDPPIIMTFTYDESLIPEGVDEKNAVIAIWDNESGRWSEMVSVVDPEANTIMAKVSHFSVYTILIHTRPAAFTTSNLFITPAEVYTSEIVNSSVLITNTGDLTGSYEVTLRIDGVVVETKEVIVGGGSSQTVNFSVTQIYSSGTYTVDINGLMGTFEVKAPSTATFTTSDLNISPNAVYLGDTVTISALITNTGNATGTHKVMLKIDGITEVTKEVTIDASTTQVVSFITTKNNAGTYTVDANGMTGSFTVSEQLSPGISVFEVTPYYDTETRKLIFAEVIYEVNNLYKPIADVELVVDVSLDAEPVEEVSLLSTSQLELGATIGSRDYIPPGTWKTGTYTFQAKLYVDGELYTSMIEEKLEVTAESAPTVVSWGILGMIISTMLLVIAVTVFIILRRRRYMLEA